MTNKTDYTWSDVGDSSDKVLTQSEKQAIADEWNNRNKAGGSTDINKANVVRVKRNTLLAETDWTQLDDVPQTTKDKYKSWRQELRDLPQHSDFPNVTIPSEPE